MADEPDNHTVRLLQEMRVEMRDLRTEIKEMRVEMNETRDDLTNRIDGNTVILNMLAGLLHDHEGRITALENRA